MTYVLSRKSYREVVRKLEHFRKQHEEDRIENPDRSPMSWGSSLISMIEKVVRGNHEQCPKGMAEDVLEYLCHKGLLIHYHEDYTFPETPIPSKEELKQEAEKALQELDNIHRRMS